MKVFELFSPGHIFVSEIPTNVAVAQHYVLYKHSQISYANG
jgi:hypothetical protein